jgi:hypothetical protein
MCKAYILWLTQVISLNRPKLKFMKPLSHCSVVVSESKHLTQTCSTNICSSYLMMKGEALKHVFASINLSGVNHKALHYFFDSQIAIRMSVEERPA